MDLAPLLSKATLSKVMEEDTEGATRLKRRMAGISKATRLSSTTASRRVRVEGLVRVVVQR